MPFSLTFNADAGICEIIVSGIFDPPLNEEIKNAAQEVILKHNCYRFIIDCREAKLQLPTLLIHKAPSEIRKRLDDIKFPAHKVRRAFVVRNDFKDFSFIETVSTNRGLQVKIFQDMDQAIKWLNLQ